MIFGNFMKKNESPLREIRIILNGTCNIPAYLKYAYRHNKKQEIGYNIQSDIMFDSIAQSYLPTLQAKTTYHKYHVKLDKLQKEKQQLLKNQKAITKSKDKNNEVKKIYYQNRITNTDSKIAETNENIVKLKNHMANDNTDTAGFFDQLGTTTIGSSKIKLGVYRGPGTKHEHQIQDALFGQSMSRRITKVAEEIYESLLESAKQDPLPQVNIQGFSRGAYSALLVTEKLNYLIEHGNRRIDEQLIQQSKQSTDKDTYEKEYTKRQHMCQMLRQKPLTIHCCANDPIPGLGSTRSSGIYHFDRANTQVENHIFTHYNTAHNQYGFQGECTNQILSSLCGINQNQHVQSGFIKHSSLQKPIITGPICNIMEDAFADTKKSVKLPNYFHPHTIPGLFTLGMFIRDINKTYKDDPEAQRILTENIVNIFNKHIALANRKRRKKIPFVQAPTNKDLGMINLIMKNTLPIQKFEVGKLIRENTGGKLQDTISESTLYYAHDRARTALEENISYTPRSLDTEKILNKLNKTSISKTLLQQRWEDIHASGQNINQQTVNYDPHDYDDSKATSFFMHWLMQPIYQIQYLITTNDQRLTKVIKLRDTLKLQIKTSIIELKKSTAVEFHKILKDHSTHKELKEIYDTTGKLAYQFDTVRSATAIKNINEQQDNASTYEADVQNYIQSLATKKLSEEFTFINIYAQKVSTVLSKLDLLYQKIHSLEDISKKVYHQKIQSFSEDIIEVFTEYGLESKLEPILHNTIRGIDSISTSLNGELHFSNILLYTQKIRSVIDSLTDDDEKTQYGILQLRAIQTRLITTTENTRYLSQFHTEDIKEKISEISAYITTELNNDPKQRDIPRIVNETHTLLDKLQKEEVLNIANAQIESCTKAHSNLNEKEKTFLNNAYTNVHAAYKNLTKGVQESTQKFYALLQRFVDSLRQFIKQIFYMQKAKSYGFATDLYQPALEYKPPKKK